MTPVFEAELKELAAGNPAAITRFEIFEPEDGMGRWYLRVYVSEKTRGSKSKDVTVSLLMSARKSPRSWGDLNNTVNWIRKLNVPKADIVVSLSWSARN